MDDELGELAWGMVNGKLVIRACANCHQTPLEWDKCERTECPVERLELGRVWMREKHGPSQAPKTICGEHEDGA